jgi:hypothetical protein
MLVSDGLLGTISTLPILCPVISMTSRRISRITQPLRLHSRPTTAASLIERVRMA